MGETAPVEPAQFALSGTSINNVTLSADRPEQAVAVATSAFGFEPVVDNFEVDPIYRTNVGEWAGDGFEFTMFVSGGQMKWDLQFDDLRYGDPLPATPTGAQLTIQNMTPGSVLFEPDVTFAAGQELNSGLVAVCTFNSESVCLSYETSSGTLVGIYSSTGASRMSYWTSNLDGVNVRSGPGLDFDVLGQINAGDDAMMIGGTYVASENRFEWCQVLVDIDIAPIGELSVAWVLGELLNDCRFDL